MKYKLLGKKMEGCITVEYEDGHLKSLQIDVVYGLDPASWAAVLTYMKDGVPAIPFDEDSILMSPWEVHPLEATPIEKKVAHWCRLYETHTGIKYKIQAQEVGKLKHVDVTDELLEGFFKANEWWAQQKTVSGYVRHYNELRVLLFGKQTKHPNYWDKTLEGQLKASELQEYWAHLRSIGWYPVKVNGTTRSWRPKEPQ